MQTLYNLKGEKLCDSFIQKEKYIYPFGEVYSIHMMQSCHTQRHKWVGWARHLSPENMDLGFI